MPVFSRKARGFEHKTNELGLNARGTSTKNAIGETRSRTNDNHPKASRDTSANVSSTNDSFCHQNEDKRVQSHESRQASIGLQLRRGISQNHQVNDRLSQEL